MLLEYCSIEIALDYQCSARYARRLITYQWYLYGGVGQDHDSARSEVGKKCQKEAVSSVLKVASHQQGQTIVAENLGQTP